MIHSVVSEIGRGGGRGEHSHHEGEGHWKVIQVALIGEVVQGWGGGGVGQHSHIRKAGEMTYPRWKKRYLDRTGHLHQG